MQDLTVTLIQSTQAWEDKTSNLDHYSELIDSIATTDLILLPEMFQTGFSMNASLFAETMENSPSINWLKEIAQRKQAAIYTSLMIQEGANYYNRGIFATPNGDITTYDKRKTFGLAGEDKVYTAGTNEAIVRYLGWKIQLQICYDLRFPEITLNAINNDEANFDLLIYVANWPARRGQHWRSLLPARAIENQCFVAAVNRVGTDATGLEYSGDSMVLDPLGESLSHGVDTEQVITTRLSIERLKEVREKLPFLKDRHV